MFREDKGRCAEHLQGLCGIGMVFSKPCQQLATGEILVELVHIQTRAFSDPGQHCHVRDIPALFVPGLEQGHVEGIKRHCSLPTGGLGSAERITPPAGIVPGLLPQLPLRSLLAIHLLQAEVLPVHGERRTKALFDSLQPDRCVVDIGSKVIEVHIQHQVVGHSISDHFSLLFLAGNPQPDVLFYLDRTRSTSCTIVDTRSVE